MMRFAGFRLLTGIVCLSLMFGEVRVKDIAHLENGFQQSLVGYGLVIGLNGTGDRSGGSRGAIFTVQTISNMLERFGITVPKEVLRTRNVAAVMVTAKTPAYGRIGTPFDVTVSSLGDASSLEGGVLMMTPLHSIDGTYYALSQGPVSIGGYSIETDAGESLRKNHATVGRVPGGGVLEVMIEGEDLDFTQPVRYLLIEPDFVTASRVADEINLIKLGPEATYPADGGTEDWLAKPLNAGTIEVSFPDTIATIEAAIFYLAGIDTILVDPDVEARIVINERTGTIVAGGNVRISEVMISHGNLTIHTRQSALISQPSAAFSNAGSTVVVQITETELVEEEGANAVVPETTTVNDLAVALNELGVKPRDIIAIFQAIKQAGALNAKLIIM